MSYAVSYHFFVMSPDGIKSTETWVFRKDSKENRSSTSNWFRRFIKNSGIDYVGNAYLDFLTEDLDNSRTMLSDGQLVIHVRKHY